MRVGAGHHLECSILARRTASCRIVHKHIVSGEKVGGERRTPENVYRKNGIPKQRHRIHSPRCRYRRGLIHHKSNDLTQILFI